MRLDQMCVKLQLFPTRALAQDAIKEGRVQVKDKVITKCAYEVSEEDGIVVQESELMFASRAGLKLYHALEHFQIQLAGRVVLDVGASTGGFSDVALQAGAKLVYAVDVGKDQLLDKIKSDPRIVNMENTNCRYLTQEMFPIKPQFVCMDVSFISILTILPAILTVLEEEFEMVLLIKPQFEAGSKDVGKNGIVKDMKVHQRVLNEIVTSLINMGLSVLHLEASSLKGRDGNQEYLVHCASQGHTHIFNYREIVLGRK